MEERIKIISPFSIKKGCHEDKDLSPILFEKYIFMISFIDSSTLVCTTEKEYSEQLILSYLEYKCFLLFENSNAYDLIQENAKYSEMMTSTRIKNWENNKEIFYTIQSIIDILNITAIKHAGYIRIAEIQENTIHISLEGQCIGCSFSKEKLCYTIENELKNKNKLFNVKILPTSSRG